MDLKIKEEDLIFVFEPKRTTFGGTSISCIYKQSVLLASIEYYFTFHTQSAELSVREILIFKQNHEYFLARDEKRDDIDATLDFNETLILYWMFKRLIIKFNKQVNDDDNVRFSMDLRDVWVDGNKKTNYGEMIEDIVSSLDDTVKIDTRGK